MPTFTFEMLIARLDRLIIITRRMKLEFQDSEERRLRPCPLCHSRETRFNECLDCLSSSMPLGER